MRPPWKRVWSVLKLKTEPPHDPAVPLLGIYTEKTKTLNQMTRTPVFTAVLFAVAEMRARLRCPSVADQVKRRRCTCTVECHSAIKRVGSHPWQ